MLNLRKKTLALALTAAVLGGGIAASQAAIRAPDGIAQVLLYPYFTTNSNWRTFIHVTNTSDSTVPVKVRFRRASDSADILDFVVVLSPWDMWTAVVETNAAGKSGVRPTDNSCTVPIIGSGKFQEFITQATEGYVEIIGLGRSDEEDDEEYTVAWNAAHATSGTSEGTPRDCDKVQQAFGPAKIADTDDEFSGGPQGYLDVLTGKFDLINVENGWAGASRAVTLAEFGAPYHDFMSFPQVTGTLSDFPNMDSAYRTTAEDGSAVWGVFAVNNALNATSVINEWVLNPGLEERSSWVVTFPTQSLTVAAVNAINVWRAAQPTPAPSPLANNFSGAQAVTLSLFNREEKYIDVGFSGGGETTLANEVNVIDFVDTARGISAANILSSTVSKTIDTAYLKSPFLGGWLRLGMPANSVIARDSLTDPIAFERDLPGEAQGHAYTTNTSYEGAIYPRGNLNPTASAIALTAVTGRPVIGFNITQRSIPTENASLYDHAYTRWLSRQEP